MLLGYALIAVLSFVGFSIAAGYYDEPLDGSASAGLAAMCFFWPVCLIIALIIGAGWVGEHGVRVVCGGLGKIGQKLRSKHDSKS